MSRYLFRCPHCGSQLQVQIPMAEVNTRIVLCPEDIVRMDRVFTPPYLRLSQVGFTRRPEPTEKALLEAWENPSNV